MSGIKEKYLTVRWDSMKLDGTAQVRFYWACFFLTAQAAHFQQQPDEASQLAVGRVILFFQVLLRPLTAICSILLHRPGACVQLKQDCSRNYGYPSNSLPGEQAPLHAAQPSGPGPARVFDHEALGALVSILLLCTAERELTTADLCRDAFGR